MKGLIILGGSPEAEVIEALDDMLILSGEEAMEEVAENLPVLAPIELHKSDDFLPEKRSKSSHHREIMRKGRRAFKRG